MKNKTNNAQVIKTLSKMAQDKKGIVSGSYLEGSKVVYNNSSPGDSVKKS